MANTTNGVITASSDGQDISGTAIRNKQSHIYITDDNQYIVVDGVKYEIYSPLATTVIRPGEDWHDDDTWEVTKVDFDAIAAAQNVFGAILGIGNIEMPGDRELRDKNNHILQNSLPTTNSGMAVYQQGMAAAFGTQIFVNILQAIADAVEFTYVQFSFQTSNFGSHRVIILGGTKSASLRYENYMFYNMPCRYIGDLVQDPMIVPTINALRKAGYSTIEDTVNMIKRGENKSIIMVSDDELHLSGKEYYDAELWLDHKRRGGRFQTYIYPNAEGNICQKAITYKGEYLRIVKRKPKFLFYSTTVLIEMLEAAIVENINKSESNLYWKLFEQALIEQNDKKNKKQQKAAIHKALRENNISDPSDAKKIK